jgi:hypothetical protein
MSAISPLFSAFVESAIAAIVGAPSAPLPPPVPVYSAMARTFPANAVKGVLIPPIGQSVVISGRSFNVSPALQVRNDRNLIVMPGMLQQTLPVRFQLDQMGNVWRIWILSANESATP